MQRLFATSTLYTAKLHRNCTLDNKASKETRLAKIRATAEMRKQKAAEKKEDNKKRPFEEEDVEPTREAAKNNQKNSRPSRKL